MQNYINKQIKINEKRKVWLDLGLKCRSDEQKIRFYDQYIMGEGDFEGGSSWSIPNTDNPGGRSGDNYDWLRYKKWVEDGGRPGEMHSNPID